MLRLGRGEQGSGFEKGTMLQVGVLQAWIAGIA